MPKSRNDVKKVKSEDLDVDKKTEDVESSFASDSVENAISPILKSVLFLSIPESMAVSI